MRAQSHVLSRIWLLYCSSLKMEVVPPLRVVYNREMEGGAFVLKVTLPGVSYWVYRMGKLCYKCETF